MYFVSMHCFLGCLDEEKNKYKDFAGFRGKPPEAATYRKDTVTGTTTTNTGSVIILLC